MSIDLRMEPYATMFENERPESRIIPELCFPDVDKLLDRLGLPWGGVPRGGGPPRTRAAYPSPRANDTPPA
jgi:hypothetical protein